METFKACFVIGNQQSVKLTKTDSLTAGHEKLPITTAIEAEEMSLKTNVERVNKQLISEFYWRIKNWQQFSKRFARDVVSGRAYAYIGITLWIWNLDTGNC